MSLVIPAYIRRHGKWGFLLDLQTKLEKLNIAGEFIIVDDASPNPVIVSQIPVSPSLPLKVIRNESRRGPNVSRNRGVAASSSEIILLVDFGDYVSEELIHLTYENLARNGSVKLTGGNYVESRKVLFQDSQVTLNINEAKFLGQVSPNGSGMGFRKETWEIIGGFDEKIFYGATDREFGLRVLDKFGKNSIEILPASVLHQVKTGPTSVFVRSFRMSRGYVMVLNKRKEIEQNARAKPSLRLLHFNRRRIWQLVRKEGLAFTLSSFLGKVIGRIYWQTRHRFKSDKH